MEEIRKIQNCLGPFYIVVTEENLKNNNKKPAKSARLMILMAEGAEARHLHPGEGLCRLWKENQRYTKGRSQVSL